MGILVSLLIVFGVMDSSIGQGCSTDATAIEYGL
jgi:hypothetical protein